jgi:hypothetical protein
LAKDDSKLSATLEKKWVPLWVLLMLLKWMVN